MFKLPVAITILLTWTGLARSQDADFPLTSLLEPNVGMCLEIHGLRRHVDDLQSSGFAVRVQSLPMYKTWIQSREFGKLKTASAWVETVVGKPPREFAGDLLGQSVALAISPTETQPKGLFLTRAVNAGVLEHFVTVWQKTDKSGEFTVLTHNGHTYTRRTKAAAHEIVYFARLGRIFVLSDYEPVVKSTIDRFAARSNGAKLGKSLADLPAYQAARNALSTANVATVFVNPRAWDASIDRQPNKSSEHKVFRDAWHRCRWLGAGLRLGRGLGVELLADYDSKNAPEAWTRVVERIGGRPEFLAHVPANALLAVAGRHDLGAAYHFAIQHAPEKQGQAFEQIGLNVLGMKPSELIDQLPPNWGMYVVPRQNLQLDVSPVEGVLAVEITPSDRPAGRKVRRAFDQGLSMGLVALSVFYSSTFPDRPARAVTNSPDHPSMKWIENLNAYELATAIGPRYLAVSSNRRVVEPFLQLPPEPVAGSALDAIRKDRFPDAGHVLFVNVKAVREFVAQNRGFFAEQTRRLGKVNGAGEQRLVRVEQALGLVDAGYASLSISNERLHVSAGLVVDDSRQPD